MKKYKNDILLCIGFSAAVTVIAIVAVIMTYSTSVMFKIVPPVYVALQAIVSIIMTVKTKKSILCPLSQLTFTTAFGILAPIVLIALGSFASRFDIRFLKDFFAMFFGPAVFSGFVALVYIIEYAILTTTSFIVSLITALITGGIIKIKENISERKI